MIRFEIRAVDERGRDVIRAILKAHWGSTWIVGRGRLYDGESLPGLAAVDCENIIGLITYNIENEAREIVSFNGLRERKGIGTALIDAVKRRQKSRIADNSGFSLPMITSRQWSIVKDGDSRSRRSKEGRSPNLANSSRGSLCTGSRMCRSPMRWRWRYG